MVVVEGIYSMDGDFGHLQECLMWRTLIAQALSSTKHIRFSAAANMAGELQSTSASRTASLSVWHVFKSVRSAGRFRRGLKGTLQYLRFYTHPYVYSCALPPVVIAAILKALELGTSQPELRAKLWENAEYFHRSSESSRLDTGHRQLT